LSYIFAFSFLYSFFSLLLNLNIYLFKMAHLEDQVVADQDDLEEEEVLFIYFIQFFMNIS